MNLSYKEQRYLAKRLAEWRASTKWKALSFANCGWKVQPELPEEVTRVDFTGCDFEEIVVPAHWTVLICDNNPRLKRIQIPANSQLVNLQCSGGQLTDLDVSSCENLSFLLCDSKVDIAVHLPPQLTHTADTEYQHMYKKAT